MTEVSEDDGDDGVSPSTAVVEMLVTVEEVGEGASPQPVGSPGIERLSMLHLHCCCTCTCLTPFFLCVCVFPSYISGVHHLWVRFLRM